MNAHPSLCTAFREVFVGMVSSTTCVFERSILSKRMKGKVAIGLVGSAASWFTAAAVSGSKVAAGVWTCWSGVWGAWQVEQMSCEVQRNSSSSPRDLMRLR